MITLAMAQPLEAQIRTRISELKRELEQNKTVIFQRGEEAILPERTVEVILAELDGLEQDLRRLRSLRDRANVATVVPWRDEETTSLTINEALELARMMRDRRELYLELGMANPNPQTRVKTRFGDVSAQELEKPTYDPKVYRALADKLERRVNALSLAIDRANNETTIPFDASAYLEGIDL